MKQRVIIIIVSLIINIFIISMVSAIKLDVVAKPILDTYVIELNEPVVYELTITNLENDDSFEIYSLVVIDIVHDPIIIKSGGKQIVKISLTPQESLRKEISSYTFEYKIKNSKNEIQKETLSINILNLDSAISVYTETIHPNSETILLKLKNNIIYNFSEIKIKSVSAFFEHEETFSLKQNEEREFIVNLNKEKLKTLDAGTYLMNSQVMFKGKIAVIESQIKFVEQEGIDTIENEEGTIIKRTEIIKKNIGNVKKNILINVKKGLVSYLFTTNNIPPSEIQTEGFYKIYTWKKELVPNEEIKIIVKTNWFYPIIILIIIIITVILINKSIYADLELRKRVSFIKTKGGQFALKVSLKLKSKKFIEKITVIDKLPNLVNLYHKFGAISPDKIDEKNKRLEWSIKTLNKGEMRVFTYIIYSKIGVVGKFELPEAKVIYEKGGKVKETTSNKSFYVNEYAK